jgi:hypothetical protein
VLERNGERRAKADGKRLSEKELLLTLASDEAFDCVDSFSAMPVRFRRGRLIPIQSDR